MAKKNSIAAEYSGIRRSLKLVRDEIRILRFHRAGVRKSKIYLYEKQLKLNLGCGSKLKSGWINIDLNKCADLTLDLRQPLPLRSDSCVYVYSEHFLEHLDYPDAAEALLGECRRVLESGGELRVGVPDTEWPLLEYAAVKTEGYFEMARDEWHPAWCHTPLEHINYHFRQKGEHRFAYDYPTLERLLARCGFVDIRSSEYDSELDSEDRRVGTLYTTASAP